MAAKRFSARIEAQGPGGAWSRIDVPFDVAAAYATRASLKVRGTLNGAPFRSSLFPNGDGTHHMMMNKALLAAARAAPGDTVQVELDRDDEARDHPMPPDLAAAVGKSKKAAATWQAFPPSARKLYVEWVEAAKRQQTRKGRVVKAVALLAAGKRLK